MPVEGNPEWNREEHNYLTSDLLKAMDMSKKKNLLEEIRKFLESHKDPNWRTLQEQHWFNQVFCQIWRKILSCIE